MTRTRAIGADDQPIWSRYLKERWREAVADGRTMLGLGEWSRGRCMYCGETFVPDTSYDGWPRCRSCYAC